MSDLYPTSMKEFYAEMDRQLRASGTTGLCCNAEYGFRRDRDIHYAERVAGFRRFPVRPQTDSLNGSHSAVPFNYIWNRQDAKPDLGYIIAPDTRVPNYSTNLGDALELAIVAGMKSLPLPTTHGNDGLQQIHDAILAYCDGIEDGDSK